MKKKLDIHNTRTNNANKNKAIAEWLARDVALWYATPDRPTPTDRELEAMLWTQVTAWVGEDKELVSLLAHIPSRFSHVKQLAQTIEFLVLARADRGIAAWPGFDLAMKELGLINDEED